MRLLLFASDLVEKGLLDVAGRFLDQHGLAGAVILGMAAWNVFLQRELRAAHVAQMEDQKAYTKAALDLQKDLHTAIDRLGSVTDFVQQRKR